jgi:hypothetical protein
LDFAAAPRSCSRSKVPTFGISRSMTNLRSVISFLPDFRINKSLFAPFESLRAARTITQWHA